MCMCSTPLVMLCSGALHTASTRIKHVSTDSESNHTQSREPMQSATCSPSVICYKVSDHTRQSNHFFLCIYWENESQQEWDDLNFKLLVRYVHTHTCVMLEQCYVPPGWFPSAHPKGSGEWWGPCHHPWVRYDTYVHLCACIHVCNMCDITCAVNIRGNIIEELYFWILNSRKVIYRSISCIWAYVCHTKWLAIKYTTPDIWTGILPSKCRKVTIWRRCVLSSAISWWNKGMEYVGEVNEATGSP